MEFLKKALDLIDIQINWIREQMNAEQNTQNCPLLKNKTKNVNLQWTGTQVEFVELVYSLHDAGSINNGNTIIKELFALMGDFFNFKVTDFYRFFSDITHRVENNRTLYLDKLKKALLQHLIKSDNR